MLLPNTSTPALEPIRALAFYLASYIDTWPDLIALHQQTLAELLSSSNTATLLQFVAPRLRAHLENSERTAVSKQNLLLRTLAQHGLESLRSQPVVGQHFGQQLLDKLSTARPATQTLIDSYYRLHLRGDALVARVGLTDKELAPALCRARTELDWLNKADVWQTADGEYLFPSLITDYFSGRIDKDSEKLLVDTISKDLSRLVGFERQWRIHLLLSAAFVSLPFPPSRSDSQASNSKQKGITLGESRPRSGPRHVMGSSATKSARLSAEEHVKRYKSYAHVYIAGGCLVLAGILAVILMSNSAQPRPQVEIPEKTSPVMTQSPSAPTSDKITPENKTVMRAPQTPTTVDITQKPSFSIASPSTNNNEVVDIMALIDTTRDGDSDKWTKDESNVLSVSTVTSATAIMFPYALPHEYDLRITFAVKKGQSPLHCIVNHSGAQCAAEIQPTNQFYGIL